MGLPFIASIDVNETLWTAFARGGTDNGTLNLTGRRIIVQDNVYDNLPATIFRVLASFLAFQPKSTRARRLSLKQERVNVKAVVPNRDSRAISHKARTYSQRAKQCDRYSPRRVGQATATIYARAGAWAGTVAGATMPLTRKKQDLSLSSLGLRLRLRLGSRFCLWLCLGCCTRAEDCNQVSV